MENNNLDEDDIEIVLDSHNLYRVVIANGKESRGNPGPQPAASAMMELVEKSKHARYLIIYPGGRRLKRHLFRQIWDDELAVIARRWALQCKLFEKDQCRDVGK